MSKVIVKQGENIENTLRKFKRVSSDTKREARKREYYLRPGLKKKEKSKEAQKRQSLLNKKYR